jgi:hypothetical protein
MRERFMVGVGVGQFCNDVSRGVDVELCLGLRPTHVGVRRILARTKIGTRRKVVMCR